MPTPVGPAPRDPNDPDLWDWGDGGDDLRSRRHLWRALLVTLIILSLVLVLLASIL